MTKLYEKNHNDEPLLREIHSDESSDPVASITQEELRIRLSEEQSRIKQLLENVTSRDSDEINENKTLFDGVDDEDREDNEASGEASKSLVHVSLYGRTNHKVHSYSVINERQQQHVSIILLLSSYSGALLRIKMTQFMKQMTYFSLVFYNIMMQTCSGFLGFTLSLMIDWSFEMWYSS